MSSTADRAEIEALFQQLVRAHAERDADAIVEAYAPDAVIYDLAPPLGRHGMNRDRVAAWLASWDGQSRSMRATSISPSRATWRSHQF
jgi:ketosteroid isomerase-like protein